MSSKRRNMIFLENPRKINWVPYQEEVSQFVQIVSKISNRFPEAYFIPSLNWLHKITFNGEEGKFMKVISKFISFEGSQSQLKELKNNLWEIIGIIKEKNNDHIYKKLIAYYLDLLWYVVIRLAESYEENSYSDEDRICGQVSLQDMLSTFASNILYVEYLVGKFNDLHKHLELWQLWM